MNNEEYEKIKDYTYAEYCDYLKNKYGSINQPYFLSDACKSVNKSIKRGKEGLFIHHVKEDECIMLSNHTYAIKSPFEYQFGDNLVYCDYLEHLLLHVMICEHPIIKGDDTPGVGGILEFIVPNLNDVYSGMPNPSGAKSYWRTVANNRIIRDKDVYLKLLKRFISTSVYHNNVDELCTSCNSKYSFSKWTNEDNQPLYDEIKSYINSK